MVEHLRHVHEHRVAAAHDQGDVGGLGRSVLQEVRPVVPLQVVHAHQVGTRGERHGLGARHADEQRPDEARTDRHGHGVDLAEPHPRLGERLLEQRIEGLDVGPSGHLRHDASETLVQVHL